MMADQTVNELRLEYLPPEILSEIGGCMPLEDLKNVSMTSKKMRRSFSRWLFHSVAVKGDRDEVIEQIEPLLPSMDTEMGQMMMKSVKHFQLHVSDKPVRGHREHTRESQLVGELPVLLATVLQQVTNVASVDLQTSCSLSEKDHEKIDDLLSQLPVYTRLYSLIFSKKKDMDRLVNKCARNSIKFLTLYDGASNKLLEIAKAEFPGLRRLILRKTYHIAYDPVPWGSLEAVAKDVSKAFPELEWFVIDYDWVAGRDIYDNVDLKTLLEPLAHAISGMPKLERLGVGLPFRLLFRIACKALASGEDPADEVYFQREFDSAMAHIAQIAPKLKEIFFTKFDTRNMHACVDDPRRDYFVHDHNLAPYPLIYHGVRNTEPAKMSVETPPTPGRHGFPRGLIY